jgi:hypothetical protein
MFESFQKNVGMTPEESSEAVSYYRAIGKADGYTTGAKLYPGIADLMAELASAGLVAGDGQLEAREPGGGARGVLRSVAVSAGCRGRDGG